MKSIFRIGFSEGTGLNLKNYELVYDTGLTVFVRLLNEFDEIIEVEVNLLKGGYSLLENTEPGAEDIMVLVQIESSETVINLMKADEDYEWVEDLPED